MKPPARHPPDDPRKDGDDIDELAVAFGVSS